MSQSVLFDAQGPRGRRLTLIFNLVGLALVALVLWWVLGALAERDQLSWDRWRFAFTADAWRYYYLPGLTATLKAAGVAILTSVAFGLIFGMGRLAPSRLIRGFCTVVVEFFRSVPVLILMIFFWFWLATLDVFSPERLPYYGVVLGLTCYNGSVIAELVRSGVHQLPRGQREAGQAIGLSHGSILRIILLPQALVAMLPSLLSQFVVILKDTALGYIISYPELLDAARRLGSANFPLQSLVVGAVIFVAINFALTSFAGWLSGWLSQRTSGRTGIRR